jgi:bifunctional non-homologous end joining protein LigD
LVFGLVSRTWSRIRAPELVGRIRRDSSRCHGPPVHQDRPGRRGGRTFNALLGRSGCATACLYAFDLLRVGGEDLRGRELVERQAVLRLKQAGAAIIYSEHMTGADGEAMFRHACRMGLEGIVSKRAASRYRSGRCTSWVKVKNPVYERR